MLVIYHTGKTVRTSLTMTTNKAYLITGTLIQKLRYNPSFSSFATQLSGDLSYLNTRRELAVTSAWANGWRFQNRVPNSVHTSSLHHILIDKVLGRLGHEVTQYSACKHVREIYNAKHVHNLHTQTKIAFRKNHAQLQHTRICGQSMVMSLYTVSIILSKYTLALTHTHTCTHTHTHTHTCTHTKAYDKAVA